MPGFILAKKANNPSNVHINKSLHIKMKKNILLLLALILTIGCTAQKKSTEDTVTGTCTLSSNNDKVYLCRIVSNQLDIVDSTEIANDKFIFKGSIEGADLRVIVAFKGTAPVSQALIVLENADISVTMPIGQTEPVVSGSKNYDLYMEFTRNNDYYTKKAQLFWAAISDQNISLDERVALKDSFDIYNNKKNAYAGEFIYSHIPENISDLLLRYCYNDLNDSDKTRILAKMKKEMPDSPTYKIITEELRKAAEMAVGKQIKDITLNNMEGKPVKLSDVYSKNKYTLIDFWASWCRPCLMEMPNVIHQYALYHDKGFEIYGISLDNAKTNWQACVQRYYMSWIQVSDLKGWQSAAAAQYNIKAIPSMILVDQKGTIVAKDLRGEELAKKLENLFK